MATLVDDNAAAPAPVLTPRRCAVAHAWLSAEQYAELEIEAARVGMHPDEATAFVLSSLIANKVLSKVLAV